MVAGVGREVQGASSDAAHKYSELDCYLLIFVLVRILQWKLMSVWGLLVPGASLVSTVRVLTGGSVGEQHE